jgi:hypothetical protein
MDPTSRLASPSPSASAPPPNPSNLTRLRTDSWTAVAWFEQARSSQPVICRDGVLELCDRPPHRWIAGQRQRPQVEATALPPPSHFFGFDLRGVYSNPHIRALQFSNSIAVSTPVSAWAAISLINVHACDAADMLCLTCHTNFAQVMMSGSLLSRAAMCFRLLALT